METKILLNEGKEQVIAFQRSVQEVITRSNELIDVWNTFQDFKQISSYDNFLELISDPVAMLDKLLIGAVDIKILGKHKLNPEIIASMLNIDRESWVSLIEGKPVKTDCIPCRSIRMIKKGTKSISLEEFQQYEKYMAFQNGRFVASDQEVKEKQKTYQVFAESPAQIATYKHWQDLVKILMEHKKRGYLGSSGLETIARHCGLRYVPDLGDIFIDENKVLTETLR